MSFRERIFRFMQGRYGTDQLNRVILITALILFAAEAVFRLHIIGSVALILLIIAYYRMFSRNISRRYQENQWFLNRTAHFRQRWYERKHYRIYKCPSCKQKVRVPKGRGRIKISCPTCGESFIKKS